MVVVAALYPLAASHRPSRPSSTRSVLGRGLRQRYPAPVPGYGQFCPMAKAAEILCERWSLVVIRELTAGSRHFNDLRRGVPLMSPTLLSRRLKQLEAAGVVVRAQDGRGVAYELTAAGRELAPLVELMARWGSKWVRRRLGADDLDAGLLMWDIRRTVDASRFPGRRVVVRFRFADAPSGKREWWLVSHGGVIDLCLEDPGFDVDVVVEAPLRIMTAIWMRDITFGEAARSYGVAVNGDRVLRRVFPEWLGASALAHPPEKRGVHRGAVVGTKERRTARPRTAHPSRA
ncbi:MAG: helix-turn-helix transcriptional regulator [Chloroflexi bacterium]|nr:helix-turn-helix transcriptional regulator [Chloroflexota bacterium]